MNRNFQATSKRARATFAVAAVLVSLLAVVVAVLAF